jgi:glutathione S-transferase
MITLYYHRGACSTANHFALEESGVAYQAIEVNLRAKNDPLTEQVRALNPMGMTPVLVLSDGTVLTQNSATLPFIADLAPSRKLLPERGTRERHEAEQWLGFIASDLHPRMVEVAWIWAEKDDAIQARLRAYYDERVSLPLRVLENHLTDRQFILGEAYSVIDAYAVVALGWSVPCQVSLDPYPNIRALIARVEARPVIRHVRQIEGPLDWDADKAR